MELDLQNEDREILFEFINESNEALSAAELSLLSMEDGLGEGASIDPGEIDRLFRTFHSIKGSAGFIGLKEVATLTHHAETLLDLIRKGKIALRKPHIDIFLEVCDILQVGMDHIQEHLSEDGMAGDSGDLIARIEALTEAGNDAAAAAPAGDNGGKTAAAPPAKPAAKPAAPAKGSGTGKAARGTASRSDAPPAKNGSGRDTDNTPATTPAVGSDALITEEMVEQFVNESTELIDQLEQDLLALEKAPETADLIHSAFRGLHSLKGNAGFFNYGDIQTICQKAEEFLDVARSGSLTATSKQISLILQVLDFIRQAVDHLADGRPPVIPGKLGLIDLMDEVFGLDGRHVPASPAPDATDGVADDADAAAMPEDTADGVADDGEATAGPDDDPEADAEADGAEAPELRIEAPAAAPAPARNGANGTADHGGDGGGRTGAGRALEKRRVNEVIRVDVNKLNFLMDLVGEIVIAEAMVSQNPDLHGKELTNFEKSIGNLQKIIRDLQELATSMRMIPLSGLFGKMRRLVRDIADKSSKKVDLEIIGGETEVDRSVIEHVSDPLVHILRNSIDHGIETPELRRKAGKRETGRVLLEAKRIGGEIWIVVDDDGAGLNRDRILAKAISKGLVSEGEELNDEQVFSLILKPGFSTAEKVTSISGRGVGMDVVSRNIEKIRGRLDIASKSGQGTRMVLRIPLTTAIVDGMLMRVDDTIYAVPTLDIQESLQVPDNAVVNLVDGQEVINMRDTFIPVVRLQDLHQTGGSRKTIPEGIVVVAENAGQRMGMLVDEILGQQQLVIKPLSDYVGDIMGVSGCSVLGNGDICLILDLASLVKLVEKGSMGPVPVTS